MVAPSFVNQLFLPQQPGTGGSHVTSHIPFQSDDQVAVFLRDAFHSLQTSTDTTTYNLVARNSKPPNALSASKKQYPPFGPERVTTTLFHHAICLRMRVKDNHTHPRLLTIHLHASPTT